jgi:ribonuclease P protein component
LQFRSAESSARLPKTKRLRKRLDFLRVQRAGRRVAGAHFILAACPGSGRVGITVSKSVGNAVTRNRVKRLVREVVRKEDLVREHLDIVIIARSSASRVSGYSAVERDLRRLENQVRAW